MNLVVPGGDCTILFHGLLSSWHVSGILKLLACGWRKKKLVAKNWSRPKERYDVNSHNVYFKAALEFHTQAFTEERTTVFG